MGDESKGTERLFSPKKHKAWVIEIQHKIDETRGESKKPRKSLRGNRPMN